MKHEATSDDGPEKTRDRSSQAETAYELIKRGIIHCELQPGSQVTEEQLADSYKVGRAAVRSALKRLYQERLVQLTNRRGYFIAPITLKHVNDIFQMRMLMEPAAARLAAGNVDGQLLHRLNELCKAQYKPGDPESAEAFLSANTEFHLAVAEATNNELLYQTLASLFDKVERVHHLGHILHDRNEEAYHEHHELVEALIAGDGERAETVMTGQVQAARQFVIDAMLSSSSVQMVNVTGK